MASASAGLKKFNSELKKFIEREVPEAVSLLVRKVSFDIFTALVLLTPVRTGRLRGGWQIGINENPGEESGRNDTTGQATIAAETRKLNQLPDFPRVFITNPVFYIVFVDEKFGITSQVYSSLEGFSVE